MKSFANALLDSRRAAARGWAERQKPIQLETIDQAQAQRELGTDDGEVDALAPGKLGQAVNVRNRNLKELRVLSHSRVSGGSQQRRNGGIGCEAGKERVLAGSAADDENSHVMNGLRGIVEHGAERGRRPVFR